MVTNVKLGSDFESYVKRHLSFQGWDVERIHNGHKYTGKDTIVNVKQPFDFFGTKNKGLSIYFDAKTVQGDAYPYSAINQDQVKALLKIHNNGFVAGFIIHFRQTNSYCFVDAKALSEVVPRASIKSRMCIDLGKEIDMSKLFNV